MQLARAGAGDEGRLGDAEGCDGGGLPADADC